MAIRLPSWLHRNRCGIYNFRIVIPLDVRVFFKSKEYRVTLFSAEVSTRTGAIQITAEIPQKVSIKNPIP